MPATRRSFGIVRNTPPLGGKVMKVGFTTQDLKHVDAHFGWAKNLAIYEVSTEGYQFLEAIQFGGKLEEDGDEDKLTPKVEAVKDCAILYVAAIGGSAAARIVAAKVHPIKVGDAPAITDLLDKLREVLQGVPPPWLRKALQKGQERSFDFAEET